MISTRTMLGALAGVTVLLAACGSGADTTGPSGPPVTSSLTCAQPNGTFSQCDLALTQSGGFTITLTSTSCKAHGNTLALTKPANETLTTDGCYQTGKTWTYPGPYPAGTLISFQITSAQLPNPASLRAIGSYPSWTLDFEDGGDADFNDMVLQVNATP
jgi:hypothetical protein